MRIALRALLLCITCAAASGVARAACPALKEAQALQDASLPAGADEHKLQGAAAQAYVAKLDLAASKAQTCMSVGSPDDRALALTTMSQIRYVQAWELTHDGVAADRAKAVAIAKQSQTAIDAFRTAHGDLSQQSSANLDNWSFWNGKMMDAPAEACLGC
jgi:hypothetical protein